MAMKPAQKSQQMVKFHIFWCSNQPIKPIKSEMLAAYLLISFGSWYILALSEAKYRSLINNVFSIL